MRTPSSTNSRNSAGCHAPQPSLAAWRWLLTALLALTFVFNVSRVVAQGQFLILNEAGSSAASSEKINSSFSLPAQSVEVKDALEEFQRSVKHNAWEKAFKSLDAMVGKTGTGFIDRSDGVLVPGNLLVRSLLASLPPAGKNAYRVFYDAQAQALWDQASGKSELENLTKIVTNYLISSAGDRAADRLGDLYFERGDLEQAIASWRSVLNYCSDSKLPKAQLLTKIAIGLARSQRWNEFGEVEKTVRERFAGETVEIGGRRVTAGEHLATLSPGKQPTAPVVQTDLPADFALPENGEPLWQFRYQVKNDPANPQEGVQIFDVYGRPRANDFFIPSAADDHRVYLNLLGYEFGFDTETGKVVWRTGKLFQLQQMNQQMQQMRNMVAPERYSLLVTGDRVWSVSRDPQQMNQQPVNFALIARDAATGKEVFNSRRTLAAWSILGTPLLVGDTLYVGANRSNQNRELNLLVINAKDGKLQRNVTIGNNAVDQNQVYGEPAAQPKFLAQADRLYVDTHAGALVSLGKQSGTMDWGVMYESPAPPTNQYYNYLPPQLAAGAPLRAGGLLFWKGMRSTRLMGLDTEGPTIAWSRPVAKTDVLIGADKDLIYLAGEELTAYNLKTQELAWATRLPRAASWSMPVITQNRIYQFTSRGICEVDKADGRLIRILRGADLDSLGGTLLITPQAIIAVSNLAITAYARDAAAASPN